MNKKREAKDLLVKLLEKTNNNTKSTISITYSYSKDETNNTPAFLAIL